MTSVQKWKPGDVAMIPGVGHALKLGDGRWMTMNGRTHSSDSFARFKAVRPLVVIDPESNEDRDRLAKALVKAMHRAGDEASAARGVHPATVGSALREFASPTPRIEEPTGFAAVVEDQNGNRYTRHRDESPRWFREGGYAIDFKDINATRILSPGVEVSDQ